MSIRILTPEVISQIAAGEVVERPASVVKELIENSLDADSHQISISVESGGQRMVEVMDDGCGIPAGELALAVKRHATSKLNLVEDLNQIHTLGFRGEALASIGSIARLTITSRAAGDEHGSCIRVEGGIFRTPEAISVPVGTIVRVEDLFYNVPARRKFMKKETTERRFIDTLTTRYALAYPKIRFHLRQEGRESFQTSGNGNRREILAGLYGVETARQLMEVIFEEENIQITGFVSPTNITRSNRQEIIFFVNGRPVQDATLISAVVKAYHTLLMVGRFPLVFLFIELPPELVDVNVHPTKAEVRFSNPGWIFANIQRVVRRALITFTPVPEIGDFQQWANAPQIDHLPADRWGSQDEAIPTGFGGQDSAPEGEHQGVLQSKKIPLLRLVGQVASTYLVAEGPDGLYLIDQHAAHERILFEKYLAQKDGKMVSQTLLQPATIKLPPAQARLLSDQLTLLDHLGFTVEPFGPTIYRVQAIPEFLSGMDPAEALYALVEEFEEDETPLQTQIEQKMIARICKRAAIKAGQLLTPEEQRALVAALEKCVSPRTCPHGRPTMIHLSVDLLERQFGRRGAR